ncbi:uncharacterized protein [Arachis hypogaea]|uniref:uncharacterized protein n=1 Tax=Arachis hypogaea TaxID=3818 RepID=UPI000DEC57CD|nr:uncharacterized protein LOC112701385 [Arachis hypogaea]
MLSLLIPGPQSLGKDIDVYLQPLIEDLKLLWEKGVETYDASKNETFHMRAALLWTINDFPAYAMLSGWSTKGKLACPCCNKNTSSLQLKHSRKTVYMDHRVFLPMDHPWRTNTRSFNGKLELRPPPPVIEGPEIFEMLQNAENVFGKKQSKTKDHLNARYDLKEMGIWKNLQPKEVNNGKRTKLAKACFSMTAAEKSVFCGVLKTTKLPDGSTLNISGCVHLGERKVYGYKTHDAHFMLHYLLPIPIKSILPDHVAIPLIRLSSFFRRLCKKFITLEEIDLLELEIVETLCQLERIFPLSFFDIMVHLPIHLANEVRLGGLVQFCWMYPPERYMCTLKSYVRNRSRPEGSIAEAYLAEECLTFCSRYLHGGVQTRLNKRPRNDDDPNEDKVVPSKLFSNKGHSLGVGNGEPINLDDRSIAQAHVYVLHNCEEVTDYVRSNLTITNYREHEEEVNNQRGTKWRKSKVHNKTFAQWFETRARDPNVPFWLKELSRGPSSVARRFSGYVINGYRFHTVEREARRKTQNSGFTLTALTSNFASAKDQSPIQDNVAYYGRLFEIVELDYFGRFKVVLFQCEWYDAGRDKYGLTFLHFHKKCFQVEPFILASQAHQCFYVQDPYEHNKHYVIETVPRDLFKTSNESESEARQTHYSEQHEHITSPAIPANDRELILERTDLRPTVIETVPQVTSAQEYEADFIGDSDSD